MRQYTKMRKWLEGRDFKIMLLPLLLLIVLPAFAKSTISQTFLLNLMFSTVFVISTNCLTKDKFLLRGTIILGLVAVSLSWLTYLNQKSLALSIIQHISFFGFSLLLFIHLIKTLYHEKDVDLNLVFGALNGYIIIGLMGSFLMIILDDIYPPAYLYNTSGKSVSYYDYFYHGFVNLTTIGHGDIVPAIPPSKALSILQALFGQLYMAVIVALIVGKYMNHDQNNTK